MGTLDYFINDKHIKDRVVNVPKDVYFCFLFLFIDMKILKFKIINNNYYFNICFYFSWVSSSRTCRSYKILSLSTISTPTPHDDIKE
jgi:hypothetical protein